MSPSWDGAESKTEAVLKTLFLPEKLQHWHLFLPVFACQSVSFCGWFQKAGSTDSESDPELWADEPWDGKLRVFSSRTAEQQRL